MKSESNDSEQAKRVEEPPKSWYVYICESKARHYYVGISHDPIDRIRRLILDMAQRWHEIRVALSLFIYQSRFC